LKMALLVLSSVDYFRTKSVDDLLDSKKQKTLGREFFEREAQRTAEMLFNALKGDPLTWLGDNVPGNPEYESMRKMHKNIYKAATGIDLDEGEEEAESVE
jgi:hypothetical protein